MRTQKEYAMEVQNLANDLNEILNERKPETGILYGALKLIILQLEVKSKEGWRAVFDSKQMDAALMQRFFAKEMKEIPGEVKKR